MNKIDCVRLNIALIPDRRIVEKAVVLSKFITTNYETAFTLDNHGYFPHITLFSPVFPCKNSDKVIEKLEEVSKERSYIKLFSEGVSYNKKFLMVNFKITAELFNLHIKVLKIINPLRENLLRSKYKDQEYLRNLTDSECKNIKKWGYPRVMDDFDPHLTISKLKRNEDKKHIENLIKWDESEIVVPKIGVFTMGKNGTCIGKEAGFKLFN
jgi:2'-5' RNA ligase